MLLKIGISYHYLPLPFLHALFFTIDLYLRLYRDSSYYLNNFFYLINL